LSHRMRKEVFRSRLLGRAATGEGKKEGNAKNSKGEGRFLSVYGEDKDRRNYTE